jgi:hypothetical protein
LGRHGEKLKNRKFSKKWQILKACNFLTSEPISMLKDVVGHVFKGLASHIPQITPGAVFRGAAVVTVLYEPL